MSRKDLGIEESSFEGIVESAFATMRVPIEANPVPVTRGDILNLCSRK